MAKVSIVIPVYGVESYIEKCARHLFEQTLDDIEFLFIDDCTPDNSIKIMKKVLENYPNRIKQVRVIQHEKNLGLVFARRTGYQAATGDYIISCDSDDWMDRNMCEKMYVAAIESGSDVVWCDFFLYFDDSSKRVMSMKEKEDKYAALKSFIVGPKWGNIWSHLVKREIVNTPSIIWPEWNFGEDLSLTFQFVFYSNKLKYLPVPLYYYRTSNPNSYSNASSKEKILKNVYGDIKTLLLEIDVVSKNLKYSSLIPYSLGRLFLKKCVILSVYENPFEAQRQWLCMCPEIGLSHLLKCNLSWKLKFFIFLLYMHLYPLLYYISPRLGAKFS